MQLFEPCVSFYYYMARKETRQYHGIEQMLTLILFGEWLNLLPLDALSTSGKIDLLPMSSQYLCFRVLVFVFAFLFVLFVCCFVLFFFLILADSYIKKLLESLTVLFLQITNHSSCTKILHLTHFSPLNTAPDWFNKCYNFLFNQSGCRSQWVNVLLS